MNVQLNPMRRRILVIGAASMSAMLVYPPWQDAMPYGASHFLGYSWIWSTPPENHGFAAIHLILLLMQWLTVMAVAGVAFVLADSAATESRPGRLDSETLARAHADYNRRRRWSLSSIFTLGAIMGAVAGFSRGGNASESFVLAALLGLFWGAVFALIGKASHWIEYRKAIRRAQTSEAATR